MGVTNVKAKRESKEERVAKITLKQGILVALLGATAMISSTWITKLGMIIGNQKIEEVRYYSDSKKRTEEDFFKLSGSDLRQFRKDLEQLSNLDDPEIRQTLKEVDIETNNAVETNEVTQRNFSEYARKSIEATQNGDGEGAALLRKAANFYVQQQIEVNEKLKKSVKSKFGTLVARRNNEVQAGSGKKIKLPHKIEQEIAEIKRLEQEADKKIKIGGFDTGMHQPTIALPENKSKGLWYKYEDKLSPAKDLKEKVNRGKAAGN